MVSERRRGQRRQYPFKRKFEETPREALGRLDKKISTAGVDLRYWRFRLSPFAAYVAESIRQEIRLLRQERDKLLAEMEQRHRGLLAAFPNANVVEVK